MSIPSSIKEGNNDIYIKNTQMSKFEKHIDSLITKILNEEIETKVKTISEGMGDWQEIEVGEELKGKQGRIDANKNGTIDREDFKLLRKKKSHKKEVDEWFFYDEKSEEGDDLEKEDMGMEMGRDMFHVTRRPKMKDSFDDESIEDAEELSQNEPTYVGKGLADNKVKADLKNKIFGSFDDEHGWFDNSDRKFGGDFDFDFDEEVFPDFGSLMSKYGDKQKWFAPNDGQRFFKSYQDKFGGKPFRVRTVKGLEEEAETEEGNYFSGKRADAIEDGKESFKVGNKTFPVKGSKKMDEAKKEKWIQKTDMKKGALHKKLNVPQDEKIPQSKLKALKKELMKKAEGDKKLSQPDSTLLKQVNLALTLKDIKEGSNKITFTENELIDFIENVVMEQKVKDIAEKNNISKKEPEGLKKTNKALAGSKKENDDYAKQVVEKMKKYVEAGSNGEFNESPEEFPESNYDLSKMKEKTMKYHPSQAVDEYIDAFAYPGQTNIVYDEIKPDDEKIEMYLKGNSKTGNAVKDKDGKALGNVVPSEVGEKFMKNYKDNLYGAEQMNVSYKRQSQPVDIAGEKKESGTLSSKRGGKNSTSKAQSIMNKLESTEDKKLKIVSEEMNKMKNLISYNRKTQ
jgi:hypothetical protein